MTENENIVRDFGNVRLSIYEAGSYVADDGATKDYPAGIKISKSGYGIKVTAHELASLYQVLRSDDEIRQALQDRLEAEKKLINGVTL